MMFRKMLLLSMIATLTLLVAASSSFAQNSGADDDITPSNPGASSPTNNTGADDNTDPGNTDASTTQPKDGDGKKSNKSDDLFGGMLMPAIMIGVFVLMYIWMGRGRKKREAKRKSMLAALKKGDKVTSIGGVVGIVVEVRDDEVILKVDENNNIRMRFARWAIRGVGDQAKTEAPEDK